jgi:two-component system, cell cycle response regulator
MARILIIEDNATNLGLMSYLLIAHGHAVEGCRDGQSGLEALRRRRPDLALCDVQLPRMSGLDIARALRADPELRDLPLVAVTAMAMRGDREEVLAAGFSGYIEKPILPERFALDVDAHLPEPLRGRPRPPTPSHPPAAPANVAVPSGRRRHTVLVVDDVATNLSLMRVILESGGFHVLTARDMQLGLGLMRSASVDLVVTDLHMLSGDGFAFRRSAAADPALAGIPFMLVSSSGLAADDREEAERLGIRCCLQRPLEPRIVLEAARQCLEPAAGAGP